MPRKDKIFIFGAGGHAKVVADVVEREAIFEVAFLVDDDPALEGQDIYGLPVLGGRDDLLRVSGGVTRAIVAIGDNRARLDVSAWLQARGFHLARAIHPSVQLARGVTVGPGSVIMAGAVLNPDAKIGENCVINTRAVVEHDCRVEDGAHCGPGSILCGGVRVDAGAFIGAGAIVTPNVHIGEWGFVRAGATVTRDLPGGGEPSGAGAP